MSKITTCDRKGFTVIDLKLKIFVPYCDYGNKKGFTFDRKLLIGELVNW
jgi:hypothetical protein